MLHRYGPSDLSFGVIGLGVHGRKDGAGRYCLWCCLWCWALYETQFGAGADLQPVAPADLVLPTRLLPGRWLAQHSLCLNSVCVCGGDACCALHRWALLCPCHSHLEDEPHWWTRNLAQYVSRPGQALIAAFTRAEEAGTHGQSIFKLAAV